MGEQASWSFRDGKLPRKVEFKRPYWEVGEPNSKGIAIVFGDDDSHARLIAAAPGMLAALQALTHRDNAPLVQCDAWSTKLMDDVRAAIAKATGRVALKAASKE